jgi:hypothetical protein
VIGAKSMAGRALEAAKESEPRERIRAYGDQRRTALVVDHDAAWPTVPQAARQPRLRIRKTVFCLRTPPDGTLTGNWG